MPNTYISDAQGNEGRLEALPVKRLDANQTGQRLTSADLGKVILLPEQDALENEVQFLPWNAKDVGQRIILAVNVPADTNSRFSFRFQGSDYLRGPLGFWNDFTSSETQGGSFRAATGPGEDASGQRIEIMVGPSEGEFISIGGNGQWDDPDGGV